jgi:hypothetical protein
VLVRDLVDIFSHAHYFRLETADLPEGTIA